MPRTQEGREAWEEQVLCVAMIVALIVKNINTISFFIGKLDSSPARVIEYAVMRRENLKSWLNKKVKFVLEDRLKNSARHCCWCLNLYKAYFLIVLFVSFSP